MSDRRPFEPFDPLLKAGRPISYRTCWNLLTGSMLASILLQQIIFRWQRHGRKPFYKYAAPCDSARLGDSWQEELGFSRRQFERARSAIAVRTRRHLKDEKLKTNMVVYWTEPNHRTYYAINESLLLTQLADALVSTGPVAPDAHTVLWPIAAHSEHHTTAARNEQRADGQYVQPPMDESANSCTERTRDEQQRDGGGGMDLDEGLVDGLERLGDNNPRGLVARYPAAEIRHWLDYALSPQGDNLHNKAGFIRSKLKQSSQSQRWSGSKRSARDAGTPGQTGPESGEPQRIWSACLAELVSRVSPEAFSAWLEGTRGLELRGGTLRIAVGNKYARDTLNHSLRPTLEQAVADVTDNLTIEFIVIPNP
jgi:hypothetical protein